MYGWMDRLNATHNMHSGRKGGGLLVKVLTVHTTGIIVENETQETGAYLVIYIFFITQHHHCHGLMGPSSNTDIILQKTKIYIFSDND